MQLIDLITSPWAIKPGHMEHIGDVYNQHIRGPKLDLKAMEDKLISFGEIEEANYDIINGNAIIPIKGSLMKNPSAFSRIFYGARGTKDISTLISAALKNSSAERIILDIDSPGGTVDGTQELANFIYDNRGKKEIVAYSDGMIASAAMWIASAADKRYISGDTVELGSIGVYMMHADFSKMNKEMGINITELYAGKYKTAASPNKPLDKESKEYLQAQIDYLYSIFVEDVARNLGVSVETVLSDMADAKIFIGKQAITAGLVDGVSTFDELIHDTTYSNGYGTAATSTPGVGGTVSGDDKNAAQNLNQEERTVSITVEQLRAEHAEVYNQVFELGKAEASKEFESKLETERETARNEGAEKGAQEERSRIEKTYGLMNAGNREMVEKYMFSEPVPAGDAALAINQAEKERLGKVTENLEEDGKGNSIPASEGHNETPADTSEDLPVEEQAKAKWDSDSKIRAEFRNDYDSYLAYFKHDKAGRVRILGR
jgi:capsid assembly protease